MAISSPSVSIEKEYHPEFETQIESESGDITMSARKSSENPKKSLFERVWSENDEISILEAVLEHAENKRKDPVSATADMTQFYNTFKQSFHRNITRLQLADKVRRLKKKFKNNIARKSEKKEDKDSPFSKPHEAKLFQLSNKIWGSIGNDANEALNVSNNVVGMHKPSHNLRFDGLEDLVRECGLNLSQLETKDKAALEEKWIDYNLSKWVTFGKKAALDKELMQQALDAHKSGRV